VLTASFGEPTVKESRDVLPLDSRRRSMSTGLLYFAGTSVVYAATFALLASADGWLARVAFALVNGLVAGMMFIVGHDACHGSLTPSSKVNTWLARLAFLPSWHPSAAWEYSHNVLHHGWTNLRGKDPVYCPMTLEEYHAMPRWRQRVEQLYRSWPGMLPLYLGTIWWPLEMHPTGEHRRRIDKRKTYAFDRRLVGAFVLLQVLLLAALNADDVSAGSLSLGAASAKVAFVIVAPFLVFAWLMAFATFQHHTHPRVIWYADEDEWTFYRSQVEGTVHVVFPRWLEVLLHNIMEHTAHHIDTRVPLYHLNNAQRAVEDAFGPERVITEQFSFAGMSRVFRVCQLYDYETHQWMSFDGLPMTEARSLQAEARARTLRPTQHLRIESVLVE
jgi:omega-6 fatty acid desaturase (delta-12 desaturase)